MYELHGDGAVHGTAAQRADADLPAVLRGLRKEQDGVYTASSIRGVLILRDSI